MNSNTNIHFPFALRPLEIEIIVHLSTRRSAGGQASDYYHEWLKRALASLNRDALVELTALMLLGRSGQGGTIHEWPVLVDSARALHASAGGDTNYLSSKEPLGFYLESGLRKIGYTRVLPDFPI